MSLHDCIQRAIDSGDLPPGRARAAQALFAARLKDHAHLGQGAEAAAAEDVWVHLRREAIRRRRSAVMQASAYGNIAEALARHRDSDGKANAASALRQLVEWGQSATHANVESTRQALESSYLRDIGPLIETHKRNILGSVRQKALTRLWVKELKGEGTGDPAAFSLAMAVRDTLERARQEFNAAGGDLAKLEGYDLPHRWDRRRVARLTPEAFATRFYDTQDWARITDRATDQPFAKSGKAARMDFLRRIHRNIVSGGWEIREPSGAGIGASLGKSRSDHRVLHFRDAESWFTANDEFGSADPFSAVVEHLRAMAHDTALMRIFGPNPEAGFEYARQAAMKLAQDRPWKPSLPIYSDAAAEVEGVAAGTRRMLDMVTGAANRAEADLFASFMAEVRHYIIASRLGGAMLSAVGDVGYLARAAHHVGISPQKVVARHLTTLASPEKQRVLKRAGVIAESAANTGVAQARLYGETFNGALMSRLSEFTMRAQGLTHWTDTARGVFKLEFYGWLADNHLALFHEVDEGLRKIFEDRGITADDWEIIRTTDLHYDAAEPSATFIIPDDIRRRADLDPLQALDLFIKLQATIQEQVEFAVPSASLRGRAALQVGKPGTIGGELLNSALMFKSFTLTNMYNQMGRVLFHRVRGNRIGQIGIYLFAGALAGAVSIQLKTMIPNGRDPQPMDEGKFWLAALIQGGGLGIFGDFLYSSQNRFGGGFAETVAGPVVGLGVDVGRLAFGENGLTSAIWASLSEKDPAKAAQKWDRLQTDFIRFVDQNAGPTNIWYFNLAMQRWFWDTLTEWADPDAPADFAKAEKKRIKEYQTPSYWPQGELLPPRLPDLSNMFGASP
jgi:hypothetical protein